MAPEEEKGKEEGAPEGAQEGDGRVTRVEIKICYFWSFSPFEAVLGVLHIFYEKA